MRVGGQAFALTQEASAPKQPLLMEPVLVVPALGFGTRSTFRLTYADGGLTSQIASSTIRFGSECILTFDRGRNGVFAQPSGSCSVNSWQADTAGSVLTIPLDLSFSGTTDLEVIADGRMLGVQRPSTRPPCAHKDAAGESSHGTDRTGYRQAARFLHWNRRNFPVPL